MQLRRAGGIIQGVVQIGAAVMEGREQKAHLGLFHDPVSDAIVETVLIGIIGQTCLGQFYRTDTAQQIFIHLVRGIKHLHIITGLTGHIVSSVDHQDQIVLRIIKGLDDAIVKLFQQGIVL